MSDIHFVDYDAEIIENDVLSAVEAALGVDLGPGDERAIFLQSIIQFFVAAYAVIDDAARQNLLKYARGAVLDEIGIGRGVPRLMAAPAIANFLFTLSTAQARDTVIPQGTRITPDGALFFATDRAITIPTGQLTGDGNAVCLSPGVAGNGYPAGAVCVLVDLIPFVASVSNTSPTQGGADTETDEAYRERIRKSPSGYSVAGPAAAYEFHARSASPSVLDVSVTSPAAGEVLLSILAPSGVAEEGVLNAVYAACNARDVRPLTDLLHVASAVAVDFQIDLKYYTTALTEEQTVQAIEAEGGAIDQYVAWQCSKIGRGVNPDYLRMLLIQAGAVRVDITLPEYAELAATQVARLTLKNIEHGIVDWG